MSTIHFDHSNLQPKRPCNQSTCNDGTSTPSTDTYSSRDGTFYWLQTRDYIGWHLQDPLTRPLNVGITIHYP